MATPVKSSERNSTVAEVGDQKAVRETLFLVKQWVKIVSKKISIKYGTNYELYFQTKEDCPHQLIVLLAWEAI